MTLEIITVCSMMPGDRCLIDVRFVSDVERSYLGYIQ